MAYGCTITVDTGKIPSSQSNFVWLATEDNFPSAAIDGGGTSILNGGGNLRCYTDDTKATQLPIEVVTFVTGGTPSVQVWGLSPTLAVASTVYIEADSVATTQPAVTGTYGRNAVHDYPTYNGYDGTDSSGQADLAQNTTLQASSFIGEGFDTNGDSQTGSALNSSLNFNRATEYTIGGWVNLDVSQPSFAGVFSVASGSSSGQFVLQRDSGGGDIAVYHSNAKSNLSGAFSALATGTNKLAKFTWDGATSKVYIDGSLYTSVSQPVSTMPNNTSFTARIGGERTNLNGEGVYSHWKLEKIERSSDYIEAEYNNQSDSATFWTTSAWAEQSSDISVTEQTNNSNYTANNPTITLTGSISITESVSNTSYTSANPAIVLTGVISIAEQAKNTTYTSLDPIIDLTGLVEITESTTNTSYNIQSPTITLTSGAIEITEAAAGTQYNSTSPSILLTPEPLGIVSTVCFNGTITEVTFNGVNVDLSYTGKQQDIVFNGNFNDLQFNGTIQTTCNTGSIKTNC